MLGFLAPLLGGLGGLLFPAAGAAATGAAATGIGALLSRAALPALGAGLGTLASGGGGKDAIRNALMMGVGVSAFPNLAGGLADIFGGQSQAAPTNSPPLMDSPQFEQGPMSEGSFDMNMVRPEFGTGMPRMTTLPSIRDINAARPEYPAGIPAALPRYNPGFAMGGEIEGPGTGSSDSIPATIYQGGKPVQKAALSDGEFVMTADAVKGAGNGSRDRGVNRMYELMRRFESGEMV